MVKKLKSLAKSDDKQLADAVRASAHQIWQAGLGAFAKAQEEGGKVFAKLVKEGTDLQKRTQTMAESKVSGVTGTVSKVAGSVSKQASGSWDKLEQVFEDRVSRALASLGAPSTKDIQALTKRVEELSKAVAELSGKKPATVKESKPAAKKSATKAIAKTPAKAPAKAVTRTVSKTGPKTASKSAPKVVAKKPAAKAVAAKTAATKKKAPTKTMAKPVDTPAGETTPVASEN